VGTGYFDAVAMAISGGKSSTTAMAGSTETAQFHREVAPRPAEAFDDGLVHRHEWATSPAK
jgi:isocitrate lyase